MNHHESPRSSLQKTRKCAERYKYAFVGKNAGHNQGFDKISLMSNSPSSLFFHLPNQKQRFKFRFLGERSTGIDVGNQLMSHQFKPKGVLLQTSYVQGLINEMKV